MPVSSDNYSLHPWYIQYTYAFLKYVLSPPLSFIWVRRVVGINNIPATGPAIIAFNHQSYFDFLLFIAVCPRQIHFLSAEKFFTHWFWKHLMRLTGQIKVHREEHDKSLLHASVSQHLEHEKIVGIFPEGTRSPYKNEMLKAFTGIAQFALKHGVPIIPVGIRGTYDVMAKHDVRPHFKKVVEFYVGRPMYFHEHYGMHTNRETCVHVTESVIKQIEMLSGKIYSHYESRAM